jgi:hypothetical protein
MNTDFRCFTVQTKLLHKISRSISVSFCKEHITYYISAHASLIKQCEDTKFGFCVFTRTEKSLEAIIPFVKPQEKDVSGRERMYCLHANSCTELPPTTAGRS